MGQHIGIVSMDSAYILDMILILKSITILVQ